MSFLKQKNKINKKYYKMKMKVFGMICLKDWIGE